MCYKVLRHFVLFNSGFGSSWSVCNVFVDLESVSASDLLSLLQTCSEKDILFKGYTLKDLTSPWPLIDRSTDSGYVSQDLSDDDSLNLSPADQLDGPASIIVISPLDAIEEKPIITDVVTLQNCQVPFENLTLGTVQHRVGAWWLSGVGLPVKVRGNMMLGLKIRTALATAIIFII